MQKKVLVAAVAALVAVPVFAGVSIYGTADLGLEYVDFGIDGTGSRVDTVRFASNMLDNSAFGVKGQHKLDKDVEVGFQFEAGFNFERGLIADSVSNVTSHDLRGWHNVPLWGRVARLYFTTKYGELSFGRQPGPISYVRCNLEPTCGGLSFTNDSYWFIPHRIDNSVKFTTNGINGVTARFAYSMGDQNVTEDNVVDLDKPRDGGIAYSATAEYNKGKFYLGVGINKYYEGHNSVGYDKPDSFLAYVVGLSYDAVKAKIFASFTGTYTHDYPDTGGENEIDRLFSFSFGVSMPVSKGSVVANFSKITDKTRGLAEDRSSKLFGVGYLHNFTKDLTAYVSAARMITNGNWAFPMGTGSFNYAPLPLDGTTTQFGVGFKYNF